jgi:hypothetical protein
MVFDFCGSIIAKSVLRLSLNHAIDEVGCFNRPTSWDFALLYLHLL